MTETASLGPSDPREIGGYALVARLREDDQGRVYLADDPSGGRVEVVWLREEMSDDGGSARLAEETAKLAAVSVSSIAQTIASGTHDGRPYLVVEHVDGLTLRAAVERGGPLAGAVLHRLAISTMTALVALHQAGVAHGDLHPANVLLGPDGVRVTGAAIARLIPAGGDMATRALAGLAYLAPERLGGTGAEPPGDMFAWAATLAFAATGRDPFEGGTTSATINRVLREEPDLAALDEHLHAVAAACLSKEPTDRPQAADALLGLVGHTLLPIATAPPAAEPPTTVRSGAWRRRLLLGAGAVVLAATGTTGGHLMAAHSLASVTAAPSPAPAPSLDLAATVPRPSAPPKTTSEVSLPGIDMTLHENPADPVRVVAYRSTKEKNYVRTPGTDEFKPTGLPAKDVSASPDGSWVALVDTDKTSGTVTFLQRAGSGRFSVAVPASAYRPNWDRASTRLLLTLAVGKDETPTGFVLVDVAKRTVTQVDTDDETRGGEGVYAWLPDGSGVVVSHKTERDYGMRVRDLTGREVGAKDWVGYLGGRRMFSPSGMRFLTNCPSGGTFCVWDTETGVRRAAVGLRYAEAEFWGWYDENHIMVLDPRKDPNRVVAMDLLGRPGRVLLTVADHDYPQLFLSSAKR